MSNLTIIGNQIHKDGPHNNFSLAFESDKSISHIKQTEQLRIISAIEDGMSFSDGSCFASDVHFQNSFQVPVQRWFPYREGYSPHLVESFIKCLNIKQNIFDPFSGSGTTLLASRLNNINSFGIDINPISALVGTVKNAQYTSSDITSFLSEIDAIQLLKKKSKEYQTPFLLSKKVFNEEILQSLLQLKYYIYTINNAKIQKLVLAAWLSIIEAVSNIKKEGNGIKYKNRKRTANGYISLDKNVWEKSFYPDDKFAYVKNKLLQKLKMMAFDLQNNYGSCKKKPIVMEGNCLEFDELFYDDLEFTFFSPPYCNCFDYFEIHKVDLWLGDFVSNQDEFRSLRNLGFRSNTNSLNNKVVNYENRNIEALIELFDEKKLWSKKIPNVIRGYFDDTHKLLNKLHKRTIKGGYVGIVVGNSAYSGVIIPTDVLIANIAKEIGFNVKEIFIVRHLTTSSQQKKELESIKHYLRESVVLLRK